MNKLPCHIVKDLLPLFVDDVVSEDTANAVRDHLEECGDCREDYRILLKDLTLSTTPRIQEENTKVLKDFKKKWTVKKFLISAVSTAVTLILAFFLFVLGREYLFDAGRGILAPTIMRAFSRVEAEDGWTRLSFQKDDRWFHKADGESMDYLEFGTLYEKEIVNSGNNLSAVEIQVLDTEGNILVAPFTIEPGRGIVLSQLEKNTPYIVQIRGEGFFEITFS